MRGIQSHSALEHGASTSRWWAKDAGNKGPSPIPSKGRFSSVSVAPFQLSPTRSRKESWPFLFFPLSSYSILYIRVNPVAASALTSSSFPRSPFSHSPPPLHFSPFRNKCPALMNYLAFSFLEKRTAPRPYSPWLNSPIGHFEPPVQGVGGGRATRKGGKRDSSAPPLESGGPLLAILCFPKPSPFLTSAIGLSAKRTGVVCAWSGLLLQAFSPLALSPRQMCRGSSRGHIATAQPFPGST